MPERGWVLVLDFDGTVTLKDLSDAMLLCYTSVSFKDVRDSYLPAVVTEEWVREKFRMVKAPRKELERFVLKNGRFRDGFLTLVRFCRSHRIPVEVVSGGLDLYIRPLLLRRRLRRLRVYCAQARWTPRGLDVHYRYLDGQTLDRFKARRVLWHKRRGYRVLFAGDGGSDFQAARKADCVFARGTLMGLCRRGRIRAKPLRTFDGVRAFLKSSLSANGKLTDFE